MTTIEDYIVDEVRSAIPDEGQIIYFISKNYNPEDIFSIDVLRSWAEANGYQEVEE